MRIAKIFAVLLAIGYLSAAVAQDKPSLFTSQSSTMQASVEEIDHESRAVTLRRQDGELFTFTASPEVRNLAEVSAGDILTIEYTRSVSITVMDVDGVEPAAGEVAAIVRSGEGQMPAMAAADSMIILATVAAIDVEANTYKLEMPDGSINEYVAMNPENLELAAIGDVVVIEVTGTVVAVVSESMQSE